MTQIDRNPPSPHGQMLLLLNRLSGEALNQSIKHLASYTPVPLPLTAYDHFAITPTTKRRVTRSQSGPKWSSVVVDLLVTILVTQLQLLH